MLEVEYEVGCTVRNAAGEAFVRVSSDVMGEAWYYGDDASLDGCPLVSIAPWVENASPLPRRLGVYDFHLSRPEDVQRFSPGSKVIFRPGTRRTRRPLTELQKQQGSDETETPSPSRVLLQPRVWWMVFVITFLLACWLAVRLGTLLAREQPG